VHGGHIYFHACFAGVTTQIMETDSHTAIYSPSFMAHVNSLIIPGDQEAYTSSYACGRRCTFGPLGGLSSQPVTIAGYSFHGHLFMTGGSQLFSMRQSLGQCLSSMTVRQRPPLGPSTSSTSSTSCRLLRFVRFSAQRCTCSCHNPVCEDLTKHTVQCAAPAIDTLAGHPNHAW
jgi:hypothetical protein